MIRFSANLGFLWADLPLPEAIRRAAEAGFDAVECHWPYGVPPEDVAAALAETGLPLLGLNTRPGNLSAGEFGLAARPDRAGEAREAVDEALAYAETAGADSVHVMAGKAEGTAAREAFLATLEHATRAASVLGRTILIEPINPRDVPGYFLSTTTQALDLVREIDAPNLKIMFDCYHVALAEGRVGDRLHAVLPHLGHIQFASVPDRGPPDRGELDYAALFGTIGTLGWTRPLGAEYRPPGPVEASLGWLAALRRAPDPAGHASPGPPKVP